MVVDAHQSSASRVAAGLVTPVTGQALRCPPDFLRELHHAATFYKRIERKLGQRFWYERPALRIAQTAQQEARLSARLKDSSPGLAAAKLPPSATLRKVVAHAAMPDAARLDVSTYIERSAREFAKHGFLRATRIEPEKVTIGDDYVDASGLRARRLIWCGGFHDHDNPWLPEAALSPAKGEIIHLQAQGHGRSPWESRVVHCSGHWLLPRTAPGAMSFGATYDHYDLHPAPTAKAREKLVAGASELLNVPFEVVDQTAGIRPVGARRQPVVGCHPVHSQILMLNGLGSKGVLWAPREALRVCEMVLSPAPERSA